MDIRKIRTRSATIGWQELTQENQLVSTSLPQKKSEYSAELLNLGNTVFALPAPKEGVISFGGLALDNGDYALVMLEKVEQGELDNIDESQRNLVQQQLLARDGDGMFNQFRSLLREKAEVTISRDQL